MTSWLALPTAVLILFVTTSNAHAWGRHDLITRLALASPEFLALKRWPVRTESIEAAAADLLKRVIPKLNRWSIGFHQLHDQRYSWQPPMQNARATNDRERLLWALEANIATPLTLATGAALPDPPGGLLARYVNEPDEQLDNNLNVPPYLERLRTRMSLFFDGTSHTHTFRHYYVPSSLIPPLLEPRGIAPYSAALYAQLSIEAFRTGHRYWGYRFLAWSLHYAQDVTQPWHTVFVPSFSFLSLSRAKIRHKIAACHYFTEALADAWLLRVLDVPRPRSPIQNVGFEINSPWVVAQWVESAAAGAQARIGKLSAQAAGLFGGFIVNLDADLRPIVSVMSVQGMPFSFRGFDFTVDGAGATRFLGQLWDERYAATSEREQLTHEIAGALAEGVQLSRRLITYVLREGGELR